MLIYRMLIWQLFSGAWIQLIPPLTPLDLDFKLKCSRTKHALFREILSCIWLEDVSIYICNS